MVNGVITNKLANLAEVLGELRSLGPISIERLESDWIVRRAVERDLAFCSLTSRVFADTHDRLMQHAAQFQRRELAA